MIYSELEPLFNPKSVAVVGASPIMDDLSFMDIIVSNGFPGEIYPINHRGDEVLGRKIYRSIKDIPGPVDYVFFQIPARATIDVIRDCGIKGVKLASFYTAGFGESEVEGGIELEEELVRQARQSKVRFLGPNCIGLYRPSAGLAFAYGLPKESGPVGAICQSGGHAGQLIVAGSERGLRFSKVISYGNAADINEADLLEYFADDPETRIVIAYIEGVREGTRFLQALKKASRTKPVIVFKGGRSESAKQTAMSHTRSMSGSTVVWETLLKQAGAIEATSIDECVDIALAFRFMSPPHGRRVGIIGGGGGASVQAADECSSEGFVLPRLPANIKEELKKVIPIAGNIFRNPVDISGVRSMQVIDSSIRLVGEWSEIDFMILHVGVEIGPNATTKANVLEPMGKAYAHAAKETGKPAALVVYAVYSGQACQQLLQIQHSCYEIGLPFYPSVQRAARAIDKMIKYCQRLDNS